MILVNLGKSSSGSLKIQPKKQLVSPDSVSDIGIDWEECSPIQIILQIAQVTKADNVQPNGRVFGC